MLVAGVDIGSVAAKAAIFDTEACAVLGSSIIPTGWNHKQAFETSLQLAAGDAALTTEELTRVVGTGYGRVAVKNDVKVVSEISCHARGAAFFFPEAAGVIDIGGQDSKAMRLDGQGSVADFVMNDKCAAGTGRFIQMVSNLLEMDLEQFAVAAAEGTPANISNMCAVFAESEIVGLLARSVAPADIAAGVTLSVARRTAGLASRLGINGPCVFTGGLAGNRAMISYLEEALGSPILLPPVPQLNGAIGAALSAT